MAFYAVLVVAEGADAEQAREIVLGRAEMDPAVRDDRVLFVGEPWVVERTDRGEREPFHESFDTFSCLRAHPDHGGPPDG